MGMRRNVIIASVGTALSGVLAAGFVAVSTGADAAPVTHTIKLISTQTAAHQFSKSSGVSAGTDRHKGKVIGYDVLSISGSRIVGSFATRGGVIHFRIPFSKTKTLHGRVTGGSGRFAGVSGTIAATPLNKAQTRTAVKIVYHH
jgi:hypothetical protein